MSALLVFAVSWLLIAFRRLRWLPIGRPAGALAGAVGMVVVGALTPAQAYAAIDHDTLTLLLGMMGLVAYLDGDGLLDRAAALLLRSCRDGRALLVVLATASAVLSAALVNDAVCLFLTPVVVATCRRASLPFGPYLIAVATSANLGSAATAVGNPQNMILAQRGDVGFTTFLRIAGPAAAVAMLVNVALLLAYYGRQTARPLAVEPDPPRPVRWTAAVAILGVLVGFLLDLHMGWTALAGLVAVMLVERVEPARVFQRIDWTLLLFFAGLFVVVAGFEGTGVPAAAWARAAPGMDLQEPAGVAVFTAAMALGSNVVSNVPLALIVAPYLPTLMEGPAAWVLLAFVLTVAGNLTLVGSVANLIVAEGAGEHYHLGFWEYLRFGAVSTALTLAVGVPIVLLAA